MLQFFQKNKEIILYALLGAVIMAALNGIEYHFLVATNRFQIYAGIVAVVFTILGVWASGKFRKPETIIIEKKIQVPETDFVQNDNAIRERNISKRELEVLEQMANGLSNQEIADALFVSVNTIKTHSSRLFEKLEAKRRTQALENARKIGIIP